MQNTKRERTIMKYNKYECKFLHRFKKYLEDIQSFNIISNLNTNKNSSVYISAVEGITSELIIILHDHTFN